MSNKAANWMLKWNGTPWVILAACVFKLWLLPLPSSFWVDEMVTAFVVHHGADHPSLKIAPQVVATNYYALPRLAERFFGFSEVTYRAPSVLLMAIALFALYKIAGRVIHPSAGWFVVFAAFTLRGINYEAADARPYALAIAMASLATWFLVLWLDSSIWYHAGLFVIFSSLLWRTHLIVWPFYFVFALYVAVQMWRKETPVSLVQFMLVTAGLGVGLAPVLLNAITIMHEAGAHVVTEKPSLRELVNAWKIILVGGCAVGAWIFSGWILNKHFRARPENAPRVSAVALVAGWWILYPLSLFAFSWLSGSSVFVTRYLSPALPGAALAGTLAAAAFLPAGAWRPASLVLGMAAFLFTGSLGATLHEHHNSRWREAAQAIRDLQLDPATPMLLPSPFIEAVSPLWRSNLALPAFLYCHLEIYETGGKKYLLPFHSSQESREYAQQIAQNDLPQHNQFVIYGGERLVRQWQEFMLDQDALSGWRSKRLGPFGDVDAIVFFKAGDPLAGKVRDPGE